MHAQSGRLPCVLNARAFRTPDQDAARIQDIQGTAARLQNPENPVKSPDSTPLGPSSEKDYLIRNVDDLAGQLSSMKEEQESKQVQMGKITIPVLAKRIK